MIGQKRRVQLDSSFQRIMIKANIELNLGLGFTYCVYNVIALFPPVLSELIQVLKRGFISNVPNEILKTWSNQPH